MRCVVWLCTVLQPLRCSYAQNYCVHKITADFMFVTKTYIVEGVLYLNRISVLCYFVLMSMAFFKPEKLALFDFLVGTITQERIRFNVNNKNKTF